MTDKARLIELAYQLATTNRLSIDLILVQFDLTQEEYRKVYPETPVTPALALDIIDARDSGMTRRQLQRKWSLSDSQLYYALYNPNALEPKPLIDDLPRTRVIEALKESEGKRTQTSIAEEFGVSQAYVHKIAKELNLLPTNRKKRVTLTKEQRMEVIEAVQNGEEVIEVAKRYNISRDTIYKYMRGMR